MGDRVRMQSHGLGDRVFIRSMASRGETGGLARTTATAIQVLDACDWPLIVLETLGIGQVELDVMDLASSIKPWLGGYVSSKQSRPYGSGRCIRHKQSR